MRKSNPENCLLQMNQGILILFAWIIFKAAVGGPGYKMDAYQGAPGVYFEHLGHATLSHTAWTIIVYVPLYTIDDATFNLEQYVQYIDQTCTKMTVRNWTACMHFGDIMTHRLRHIKNTRQLLVDITQTKDGSKRPTRGLFNAIGKVSKALFGTMDDDDAQFYHEQIEHFEQGTKTLTHQMKQQLMIIKSTLGMFNGTVTDIEYNEAKMREELIQLQRHVEDFSAQLANATYLLSLKIAIESYIAKALDASQIVQRTLDVLVDNIAEAQKGLLPPRVLSPVQLLESLRNSVPSFPTDTALPFPLGKDYLFLLHQLSDVHVYFYEKRLAYVISVPLINKKVFTMWRMVPIPLPVNHDHFVYIDVRDSVLCLDQTKQFYFTMQDSELTHCKPTELDKFVCTHQRTLLSTSAMESCALSLFLKRDTPSPVCDTRVVKLTNTVWTQLSNNAWIFYAPQPDVITLLCQDARSVDISLTGIGRLQILPGCKGYSTRTLLYGTFVIGNASIQVPANFVSHVDFNHVCCEELKTRVNFDQTPVRIAYKKTTAHLKDLRSASTKVSDLLKEIDEQDWKNYHVNYRNTHSVLLVLVVGVVSSYVLFKLYNCAYLRNYVCLRQREAHTPPTIVPNAAGQELHNHTTGNCNLESESSAQVVAQAPPVSPSASHTCVDISRF